MTDSNAPQPPPVANENPPTWPIVIQKVKDMRGRYAEDQETPVLDALIRDMELRDQIGRERYGVPLQPSNGRDSLLDAYDEALDMAAYLQNADSEMHTLRLRMMADHAIHIALDLRKLIFRRDVS